MILEDIRRRLREHREDLEAEGVRSLAVFGSTVRGEAEPTSDIDLLVELDPDAGVGLIHFLDLQDRLSRLLGHKVDLISRDALDRLISDRVDAEAQQIF
jgi:predicted nucleotidyltransferase